MVSCEHFWKSSSLKASRWLPQAASFDSSPWLVHRLSDTWPASGAAAWQKRPQARLSSMMNGTSEFSFRRITSGAAFTRLKY
jgi:hypothetical protein